MTNYEFTLRELTSMSIIHENDGPRGVYFYYHGNTPATTEEVEDIAVAFYSQFNKKLYHRF